MSRFLEVREAGVDLLKHTYDSDRETAEIVMNALLGYVPTGRQQLSVKMMLNQADNAEVDIKCRGGRGFF